MKGWEGKETQKNKYCPTKCNVELELTEKLKEQIIQYHDGKNTIFEKRID